VLPEETAVLSIFLAVFCASIEREGSKQKLKRNTLKRKIVFWFSINLFDFRK
jgi:hypothetical protein